jgi:ribonuclease-3
MGDVLAAHDPEENPIGDLQECFQKKSQSLPEYREVVRTGPDHKPTFTFQVICNGVVLGEGSGETARQAKQAAAKRALDAVRQMESVPGR